MLRPVEPNTGGLTVQEFSPLHRPFKINDSQSGMPLAHLQRY